MVSFSNVPSCCTALFMTGLGGFNILSKDSIQNIQQLRPILDKTISPGYSHFSLIYCVATKTQMGIRGDIPSNLPITAQKSSLYKSLIPLGFKLVHTSSKDHVSAGHKETGELYTFCANANELKENVKKIIDDIVSTAINASKTKPGAIVLATRKRKYEERDIKRLISNINYYAGYSYGSVPKNYEELTLERLFKTSDGGIISLILQSWADQTMYHPSIDPLYVEEFYKDTPSLIRELRTLTFGEYLKRNEAFAKGEF